MVVSVRFCSPSSSFKLSCNLRVWCASNLPLGGPPLFYITIISVTSGMSKKRRGNNFLSHWYLRYLRLRRMLAPVLESVTSIVAIDASPVCTAIHVLCICLVFHMFSTFTFTSSAFFRRLSSSSAFRVVFFTSSAFFVVAVVFVSFLSFFSWFRQTFLLLPRLSCFFLS